MKELKERIMVYLDGSDASLTAAEYAVVLAGQLGWELFGVCVVNYKAIDELVSHHIFLSAEREEYRADLEHSAKKHARELERMAEEKGVNATVFVEEGLAHVVIKDLVKKHAVSMLLLGGVGTVRSRHEEFLDVVDRTMRYVSCSVMVVRDSGRVDALFDAI